MVEPFQPSDQPTLVYAPKQAPSDIETPRPFPGTGEAPAGWKDNISSRGNSGPSR